MLTLLVLIGLEALPVGHLLLDEKLRRSLNNMVQDPLYVFRKGKNSIHFTVHLWLAVFMMAISVTTLTLLMVHKRTPAYVLAVNFSQIYNL